MRLPKPWIYLGPHFFRFISLLSSSGARYTWRSLLYQNSRQLPSGIHTLDCKLELLVHSCLAGLEPLNELGCLIVCEEQQFVLLTQMVPDVFNSQLSGALCLTHDIFSYATVGSCKRVKDKDKVS